MTNKQTDEREREGEGEGGRKGGREGGRERKRERERERWTYTDTHTHTHILTVNEGNLSFHFPMVSGLIISFILTWILRFLMPIGAASAGKSQPQHWICTCTIMMALVSYAAAREVALKCENDFVYCAHTNARFSSAAGLEVFKNSWMYMDSALHLVYVFVRSLLLIRIMHTHVCMHVHSSRCTYVCACKYVL
jgi:hypothetical protein